MASERQENVRIEQTDGFERKQRVVAYAPSTRTVLVSRLSKLIWLFAGVIDVVIMLRFILKLIAANPGNGFANFIYNLTDGLVSPFMSLVNTPVMENGATIEIASIFAIVIYSLVALVVVQLLRILFASAGGTRQITTVERRD